MELISHMPDSYYSLFDNLLEGCNIVDFGWRIIYMNRAAEIQNRLTFDEVRGRKNTEIWPGFEQTDLYARMKQCMELRQPSKLRNEFIFPDGSTGNFLVSIQPVPKGILVMSIDITDWVETDRSLRESEEQYRSIYHYSTIAILFSAPDGRILAANEFACKLFRMSELEICSLGRSGLVDTDDPRVAELVEERRRTGSARGELTFIRKNGEKFEGEVSSVIFRDKAGNERTSLIIRDLTEEKASEDRLRHSEEKFNKAFLNSPDAISITRMSDGLIIDVNNSFLEISGYTREEVINQTSLALDFWQDPEDRRIYVTQLKENGRIRDFEVTYRTKYGTFRNTLVSAELFDVRGEFYILGIIRDITERKRAEEILRTTNLELQSINHIITASRYILENHDSANEILHEIRSVMDVNGGAIITFDHLDQPYVIAWQENTSDQTSKNYPLFLKRLLNEKMDSSLFKQTLILDDPHDIMNFSGEKNSISPAVHVCFHPLITRDKLLGTLCLYAFQSFNMTDRSRKMLDMMLTQLSLALEYAFMIREIRNHTIELEHKVKERTRQLTRTNEELESFSYSISHDLRAPLRAISGFSQIIRRRYSEINVEREASDYLDHIIQASARMEQLINDLLSYSRLGRKSVHMVPIQPEFVIDEVISDFQQLLSDTAGKIVRDETFPAIKGDRSLVRQICTNIIDNAIKYHTPGRPPEIFISGKKYGKFVIISFRDNGIGIPSEYLPKIFNVFQRLHNDEQYPGTGIGLATVKKAMDLLGGSVNVESATNQGTSFHLWFIKP